MLNRIHTIGHSTRRLKEFLALLAEHGVTHIADIRRYPVSVRHPHFSGDFLARSLPDDGIFYTHFEALGGRRKPTQDSLNTAWENDQFRGYADHMATPQFHSGVDRLLADDRPTVIMCAEAVPWRCHRNLLSDELLRRGIEVLHIVGPGAAQPHALSKMARIDGDRVTYPPEQGSMF